MHDSDRGREQIATAENQQCPRAQNRVANWPNNKTAVIKSRSMSQDSETGTKPQISGSGVRANGNPTKHNDNATSTTISATRRWRGPAGMVDRNTLSSAGEYGK
jgi:hypothetical protein